MDVHKAKPWHGIRGFLKEYVIIVVGVLTALGAEQLAAWVHGRGQAQEAREAVRTEIATNLGTLEWRRSEGACIDRRLKEIAAVLDAVDAGKPTRPVLWIGRPSTFPILTFQLESAAQSGRASLFPNAEQQGYSHIYGPLQTYLEAGKAEQISWAHLQTLVGPRRPTPEMVANLRLALEDAEYENFRMKLTDRLASRNSQRLGIAPAVGPNLSQRLTCLPMASAPPANVGVW
jgi:type II secretory pathway pseudopilin PulG